MITVFTGEVPPESFSKSLFLAGPSPRKPGDANWRTEAIHLLEEVGYDGVVFAPTYRDVPPDHFDYDAQVEWEKKWLNSSDLIVFWVPRDLKELPGFTTNVEYGMWLKSGKILLGSPPAAEKMTYLNWWADQEGVERFSSLKEILSRATEKLSEGAPRLGGEREVPLHLWKKEEFQNWYAAQTGVGNVLESAQVEWAFRVGKKKDMTVVWALKVSVWVASEKRSKTNEAIVFRPDLVSVIGFCRPPLSTENDWNLDSEILLVREFRSSVSNPSAMILESPGGSSSSGSSDPRNTAVEEVREETGLSLHPSRLRYLGFRQTFATLVGSRTHCFAVELTPEEMLSMKWVEGETFGKKEDSERTYVEVRTVRDLLQGGSLDWSQLGMVFQALHKGSISE